MSAAREPHISLAKTLRVAERADRGGRDDASKVLRTIRPQLRRGRAGAGENRHERTSIKPHSPSNWTPFERCDFRGSDTIAGSSHPPVSDARIDSAGSLPRKDAQVQLESTPHLDHENAHEWVVRGSSSPNQQAGSPILAHEVPIDLGQRFLCDFVRHNVGCDLVVIANQALSVDVGNPARELDPQLS